MSIMKGIFTVHSFSAFFAFLLFLGSMSHVGGLRAQSLELQGVPSGPVVGNYDDGKKLVAKTRVKNISSQDKEVKVFREVLDEVQGSENQFCWSTSCYIPSLDTSADVQTISANGGVDSTFAGYYYPEDNPGITTIRYCFYVKDDMSDSACAVVRYDATSSSTSLRELGSRDEEVFRFSPNPAVTELNIKFSEPGFRGHVQLHTILGELVLEKELQGEEEFSLDISDLEKGVHFLRYQSEDGRSKTKRVLIGR